MLFLLAMLAAAPVAPVSEVLLRRRVAEVALQQLRSPDPRWEEPQRDCAGLVRFAYRSAFHAFQPARLSTPLWRDDLGQPAEFADARALISKSFVRLGRGLLALQRLRSGDLLAFRQPGTAGEPDYHLMIAVLPPDQAITGALVVYHPGQPGAAVRAGTLLALSKDAPIEWRPIEENQAFLGFYRLKEWNQ